jgi:hypothetical protein
VLGVQLERAFEQRQGAGDVPALQGREARPVVGVHGELGGVDLSGADRDLPLELRLRLGGMAAGQAHHAQQPVEALGREALVEMVRSVLGDGALAQHGLCPVEGAPRNVDHGRLELRPREVGIELQGPGQRPQPSLAPLRVGQAEVVAPITGIEVDRAPGRALGLGYPAGADQQEGERGVGLGQVALELDGAPDGVDGAGQEGGVRLVAGPRHLVFPETRHAQADVGQRIAGIEGHRPLEVGDGRGHRGGFQRLEPDAPLGEGLVGRKAARLAVHPRRTATRRRRSEGIDEAGHDAVLQVEDLLQVSVGLGIRQGLAGTRVDGPRRDPQPLPRALEGPHHRAVDVQLVAERGQVGADVPHRLHHPHAVDDAQVAGHAQVVGDGLGDARGQPAELAIRTQVREVEHGHHRPGAGGVLEGHGRGLARGRGLDRRDEAVAAAGHRLDVDRLRRIVTQGLA